ncbi:ABC transporter permease [Dyadobacter bucti]|uniref:ABC transporter permease n=1 Tax=Dyadobacter bucti TaxID=2572203 RepID=UPI001407B6EE|nr:ABC transporter permease [Dyadobacter bucti]
MLLNYIKIAYRNLLTNKGFSAINIIGLSLGIACSIVLFLFILDELNFDTFNKKASRTYRLYVHSSINNEEANNSKTAPPAGPTMVQLFPEVLTQTRIGYFGGHDLRYKDKIFKENRIYAVDSTYFDVFTLPFLHGNPSIALKNPNSIVLTETMASKYFGSENPTGKSFLVDGTNSYQITGVMKDFPEKSHFRCDFLLSMSTYPEVDQQDWLQGDYSTYIVLKEGADPTRVERKMQQAILERLGPEIEKALGFSMKQFLANGNVFEYRMQPLLSIYLHAKRQYNIDPNTEWGDIRIGDSVYVYIFSAVALFILLIAVINFVNLSTARSEKRAKEVGIRKVIGSSRLKLIGQFTTESILLTSLSVIIALVLVQLMLPAFNQVAGRQLTLPLLTNAYAIPALLAFTLIAGLLAGSYPAFFLSSFRPVEVLKSGIQKRKSSLRSLLVITQFSISITLILGMIIIRNQLGYLQHKDLGFNKEHLLSIDNAKVLGDKLKPFKAELLKNPAILSASNSSLLFANGIPGSAYLFGKRSGNDPVLCQFLDVDADFAETFAVPLKVGRFFSDDRLADSTAVVINEAALRAFKTNDPLDQVVTEIDVNGPKTYKIIGVIKDFNYESLHRQVRPLVFHLSPVRQAASILNIRIQPNATKSAIDYIEETWRRFEKAEQCHYSFSDERLARLYKAEQNTSIIATVFSALAIFIACLGLFGLAVFITEQRTKEIGIRKVLGASISEILFLLSRQFIAWVAIAILIASPIAWYAMSRWLDNFAYRVDISWWVFVLAGFLAIAIAILTVSFQSLKAALMNPVKSLRTE